MYQKCDVCHSTARKTISSFSKCSGKVVFPKKFHWNMFFIVSSGKMIRKMKDEISQKKYMEKWHILQMFWKDGLFIKTALEYNLFLLLGKMRFLFPENIIFFLPMENERWSFSKNTWKCDVFCMLGKDGFLFLAFEITLLSKKQKWSFPQTIHLKMTFLVLLKNIHPRKDNIAILNWHSRKSSNDSLYFYRDCFKCFHISLSNENKPENLL